MNETNLTEIGVFLKKPEPEKFDFKDLMREYYEHYAYLHEGDDAYSALLDSLKGMENNSPFIKWYKYRTLDKALDTRIRRFDCDNWNDTCELTKQIYESLWGWEKEKGSSFGTAKGFYSIVLGGDSMNSVATTLRTYFENAVKKDCINALAKMFSNFGNYMRATGCVGNFVLVPANYNRLRGLDNCIHDYWDLSLYDLKQTAGQKGRLATGGFNKYINFFFLWDYVNPYYNIKSLFCTPENFTSNKAAEIKSNNRVLSDIEINELENFWDNCVWAIERRGIFMTAMLQLQKDNKQVYEKIRNEVFLSGNCYCGYSQVIDMIIDDLSENTKEWLKKEPEFEEAIRKHDEK